MIITGLPALLLLLWFNTMRVDAVEATAQNQYDLTLRSDDHQHEFQRTNNLSLWLDGVVTNMTATEHFLGRGGASKFDNNSSDPMNFWLQSLVTLLLCAVVCSVWAAMRTPKSSCTVSKKTAATTTSRKTRETEASPKSPKESTTTTTTESRTTAALVWDNLVEGPPDTILGIAAAFRDCQDSRKVNVCVGAYRDANGQPWVLPSVRQAEQRLLEQEDKKEYLPIEGDAEFIAKAVEFAYGSELANELSIAAIQTLSGTGACRIGGTFLAECLPSQNNTARTIYMPNPTWGNHFKIFAACGLKTAEYRYYDKTRRGLDMDGLLEDLRAAPAGSIIVLHACAHNPTGCDPTPEQWSAIANVLEERNHVCFFDAAYQGFASGNAERDAAALRMIAARRTVPVLLAQSFAKNFGLYGERCGTLSVVCANPKQERIVTSQLRNLVRPMYSSPPRHGSSIVKTVLSDEKLKAQYTQECQRMADRMQLMRRRLVESLTQAGSAQDWSHIESQIGMFAYTGMTAGMCDQLTTDHAIFLTRDGRVSIAGLNESNLEYVAKAIHAVTHGKTLA